MKRQPVHLICLIGPPCAGKTTLTKKLAERLALPVVRPRDAISRVLIRHPEMLGLFEKVNHLGWVTDDALGFAVRDEMDRVKCGAILENLPWDAIQLADLHRLTRHGTLNLLYLNASDELVLQRRSSRRDCPRCYPKSPIADGDNCERCAGPLKRRTDDAQERFVERLARHREYAKDILGIAYRLKIRIIALEAAQDPESLAQLALTSLKHRSLGDKGLGGS